MDDDNEDEVSAKDLPAVRSTLSESVRLVLLLTVPSALFLAVAPVSTPALSAMTAAAGTPCATR